MKVRFLVFLLVINSLISAELEAEIKLTSEEAQSLDEFLYGKQTESALTEAESGQIDTLLQRIRTNSTYIKREGEWYKISEEDENLLTKGAKNAPKLIPI